MKSEVATDNKGPSAALALLHTQWSLGPTDWSVVSKEAIESSSGILQSL